MLIIDFRDPDTALYATIARSILHLRFECYWLYPQNLAYAHQMTYVPFPWSPHPLLPFLIAFSFLIFGESIWSVNLVAAIAGALALVPTFFLASRIFNTKTAILAIFLYPLIPIEMYYSSNANIDIISIPFAMATLYYYVKMLDEKKNYITPLFGGVFLGLSFLSRESAGVALAIALSIYTIVWNRHIFLDKRLWVAFSCFMLVIMPWLCYNQLTFGVPITVATANIAPFGTSILANREIWIARAINFLYAYPYVLYLMVPLLSFFAATSMFLTRHEGKHVNIVYLFIAMIFGMYSFAAGNLPQHRFIIILLPLVSILASSSILKIQSLVEQNSGVNNQRNIFVFVIVTLNILSLMPQIVNLPMINSVSFSSQRGYWPMHMWIKNNTPQSSIIMTADPRFAFFTDRAGVQIPSGSLEDIIDIIKLLHVDYLVIDEYACTRWKALNPLYSQDHDVLKEFKLIYIQQNPKIVVYDVSSFWQNGEV